MKHDTRERLIDSAFDAFYRNGFQGANIASILQEVGINKGSMYHYFKSKKELGLAVVDERIRKNLNMKYQKVLESTTPFKTLINVLELAPNTLEYGCPLNKMSQEMLYIDQDFKHILSSTYNDFQSLIEKILQKSVLTDEIDECNIEETARLIIASYEGALMIFHLNQNYEQYRQTFKLVKNKLIKQ